MIKGRYIEQAILDETLLRDRGAARFRDQIRGADPTPPATCGSGSQPTSWTSSIWRCLSRPPAGAIWTRLCRTWPQAGRTGGATPARPDMALYDYTPTLVPPR